MHKYYNKSKLEGIENLNFILSKKDKRKQILLKIGMKCRAYRRSLSLTLSEASEQTGYSIAQLSKFEHGHCDSAVLLCMYAELQREEARPSDK